MGEVVMEIRGFIKTYLEEEKTILGPSFFQMTKSQSLQTQNTL